MFCTLFCSKVGKFSALDADPGSSWYDDMDPVIKNQPK